MKRKLLSEKGTIASNILLFALVFILVCTASFFATAGILWLINWAFGLSFWSWKVSFGVWLALALLSGSLKAHVEVKR
jgi:hypothetical protein